MPAVAPAPTRMDLLIQDANFVHDKSSILNEFCKRAKNWEHYDNEDLMAAVDVIGSYQVLAKKLMEPNNVPAQKTKGCRQAMHASQVLQNIASCQISAGCLDCRRLYGALFQIFIDWLKGEPSALHFAIIIRALSDEQKEKKKYIKALEWKEENLLTVAKDVIKPIDKCKRKSALTNLNQEELHSIADKILNFVIHFGFDLKDEKDNKWRLAYMLWKEYAKLWEGIYLDIPDHELKWYIHGIKRIAVDLNLLDKLANEDDGWHCSPSMRDILGGDALTQFCCQVLQKIIVEILKEDKINALIDDMLELNAYLSSCAYHREERLKVSWQAYRFFSPTDEKGFSHIPRVKAYINGLTRFVSKLKVQVDLTTDLLKKFTEAIVQPGKTEIYSGDMAVLLLAVFPHKRIFEEAVSIFGRSKKHEGWFDLFKAIIAEFKAFIENKNNILILEKCDFRDMMKLLHHCCVGNHTEANPMWISLFVPLIGRKKVGILCPIISESVIQKMTAEEANEIINAMMEIKDDYNFKLKDVVSLLMKSKIFKSFGERLMEWSICLLQQGYHPPAFKVAECIGALKVVNDNKEHVMGMMKRIQALPADTECFQHANGIEAIYLFQKKIFKEIKDQRLLSDDDLKVFTSISLTCLKNSPNEQQYTSADCHRRDMMRSLIGFLHFVKRVNLAADFIPFVLRHLNGYYLWTEILKFVAAKDARVLEPFINDMIGFVLYMGGDLDVLEIIHGACSNASNLKVCKDYFDSFLNWSLTTREKEWLKQPLILIIADLAKSHSEFFTEESIGGILELARSRASSCEVTAIQVIQDVSKRRPGKVTKYLDFLMDANEWKDLLIPMVVDILSAIALYDKNTVTVIVNHLMHLATVSQDKNTLLTAMNHMRLIIFNNQQIMSRRREEIADLRVRMTDADILNLKQAILDTIDGKTSEDMKRLLDAQQAVFTELLEKVDDVGETVADVATDLQEQKQELDNLKNELLEQGDSVDQIKRRVEDRN